MRTRLMGLVLLTQDHDFAGFEREITRAIELNPNYAEGHRRNGLRLFYLGQFEAALFEFRKALDLDPLSDLTNFNYAQTLVYQGRYDEAETQIRKNLEMDPGFALFHAQLSTLYRLKGNYAAAVEESAKTSELQNHPETARLKRESFAKGGWQGYLRARGDELEQNKSNPYALAIAYVELGEKGQGFGCVGRGLQCPQQLCRILQDRSATESLARRSALCGVAEEGRLSPVSLTKMSESD